MSRQMPCAVYARICGYYAPYNLTANPGKRAEIEERAMMPKHLIKHYTQEMTFRDTVLDYVNE